MMWKVLTCVLCTIVVLVQTRSHQSHGLHGRFRHPNHNDAARGVEPDERLALQHSERVAEAGTCDQPKLQVVHVSDHYPGRYFLPHCTLLHRCGKHAGCCGTEHLRCVAQKKEKVVLHFYSVRLLEGGEPVERKIEKLTFTNHTKCGCVPVDPRSRNDL